MKRIAFFFIPLIVLLCAENIAFSQQSQLSEAEQANYIAHETAQQKEIIQDYTAAEFSELVNKGYDAWDTQNFQAAEDYFRKALRFYPDNADLINLINQLEQEKIKFEKQKIAVEKDIIRQKRMLELDKAWLLENKSLKTRFPEKNEVSQDKLRDIAVSKKVTIDFEDAQIRKILEYLSKVSGINIIIDESAVSNAGELTISMKDVTLVEAIESVLRTKGLSYRFEDNFIWVSSKQNIANEAMVTRIYHLSQGLATFTTFTTFDTVTIKSLRADEKAVVSSTKEKDKKSNSQDTYEGVKIGGPGGVAGQITLTIKDVLREIVSWPEGSSIFLDNRTSTLIVHNTPSNLEVLEKALKALDVNPPQVMIEARFVEVGTDDLFSLGLKLSSEISASGAQTYHTFPFEKDQDNSYRDPFPNMTANNLNFGVLDFQEFQAVLSAIEQNTDSNTLSSPKVTTISGQEAIIKIVKEYRYPTKYEIQSYDALVGEQTRTYYATVPSDFKTRDIGIILKVTPNVGSDGKTINLTLVPEVSEFDIDKDMYNYGTESQPYLQPFFNVRNATASIVVRNNDTVVMGGLMREVVEHTVDRVPVLGKIPLLGRMFTRKYDNKQKRNLLIFVTAHIIAPTGETVETDSGS